MIKVVVGDNYLDYLLFDEVDATRLLERQVWTENIEALEALKDRSFDEMKDLFRDIFRQHLSEIAEDPAAFIRQYRDDIDRRLNGPDEF
jgi:hypothetical protein